MDKSKSKVFIIFNVFKRILKWIWRWIYIILAASVIGFSNVYYDEFRWINDTRNFIQQEQVFKDEDKYKKYKCLKWKRIKRKKP